MSFSEMISIIWSPQFQNDFSGFVAAHWFKLVSGGIAAYIVLSQSANYFRRGRNISKIEARRLKFAKEKNHLRKVLTRNSSDDLITSQRESILCLDILDLAQKLKEGHLDPLEVLEAYQARALLATEETNCVVDFIEEARDEAKKLRAVAAQERGPLFGIPISIKECFFIRGHDSTAGLARFINVPAQEDSSIVKVLRDLGAVPFCLTNVPQTMKTYACSNPVYGCTTHPRDKTRTPGGSSGGEACLLAQGGSILGVGSDIGGSLRIPSHFCGTVALKPTSYRLPEIGRRAGGTGKVVGIAAKTGFMSSSVDGVILGMRSLLQDPMKVTHFDIKTVPLQWREEMFSPKRKLKIGWYDEDGFFPATPCCKRAVHEAVAILQELGHEVVFFRPPHLRELAEKYFDYMLADGGQTSLDVWEGEILDQAVESNKLVFKTPMVVKRYLLKPLFHFISRTMENVCTRGLRETKDLWKSLLQLDDIVKSIFDAWQAEDLDVVLCPGFAFPAPPITNPGRLVPAISYCGVYNILDFPVGTLPVSRVNANDQAALESYPKNEDLLYRLVYNGTRGTQGFPLNVQVIGKPWQEELILHVMKIIETHRSENFP